MNHLIPEDTLCEVVLEQQGQKRFRAFQSDNVNDSHEAAREYLNSVEHSEGYDVAALVFDGYSRCVGESEKVESLILQLFTLDSYANRRIIYPYERLHGEIMPLEAPRLIGEWSESEAAKGETWVLNGMQDYYRSINANM